MGKEDFTGGNLHRTPSGNIIDVDDAIRRRNRSHELSSLLNSPKEKGYNLSFSMVGKILGLIATALILVAIYRIAASGGDTSKVPTFTELLNIIQGAPVIQIPMLGNMFSTWTGQVDWGYFYFLQVVFEFIGVIVDVWLFICNGMLSIYTYLYYFIVWIFV